MHQFPGQVHMVNSNLKVVFTEFRYVKIRIFVACFSSLEYLILCPYDLVWTLRGHGFLFQRVPLTEKSGRIHTSAVSVAILPQASLVNMRDAKLLFKLSRLFSK